MTVNNSFTSTAADTLPSQAKVVIIGGGIMGCGIAYHLAHEGCNDVVLLEKAELTSGSTWHAAGQITYSTSSYSLAKCIDYNINLYDGGLEAETGQSVTWHGCGSFRMIYSDDDMDWAKHSMGVIKYIDRPIEIIDVEEAKKIHPFYNYSDVKAVVYTPEDGHADPAGIAFALAAGAKNMGVKIVRHCRSTGITQLPSGEWKVSTEKGDIICEHVVNAGGCYAKQIGDWNNIKVPTTSVTHHYFVTEPIEEFKSLSSELPVVRDDSRVSGYLRMEQKAGLIGIYEKSNINSVWENECPWDAENELFEPDYDRVLPWLEGAFEKFPILGQYGIKRVVHGAISHPPDGNPLIGPAAGAQNYWLCCGTQIAIGWGPGLTRELAKWILHGSADISMRAYDPRRFGPYATTDWLVTKGKEDYSFRHELPYPHQDRPLGRPIKTSALYQKLHDQGAVFEEVYGFERPLYFARDGISQEHHYGFRRICTHDLVAKEVKSVREQAGVIDLTAFAKIMVSGKDANQFLDNIIANKMPKRDGGVILGHMLNRMGRFEVEVSITRLSENEYYLGGSAFLEQRLMDHLNANKGDLDVSINNRSIEWNAIALQGPNSRKILSQITKEPLDNQNFRWLSGKYIDICGHTVIAIRVSYSGELGWEIHGSPEAIGEIYDALFDAGKDYGLMNYGSLAMNALRMEKGFHGIGELTNEVTMAEAGLWRFARIDKGQFIGSDATRESMESRNLPWICAYMEIEPDGVFDGIGSETVLHNGKTTGMITSIAYGHTMDKIYAFAYVKMEAGVVGNKLEVLINNESYSATVISHCAYDQENLRPRMSD